MMTLKRASLFCSAILGLAVSACSSNANVLGLNSTSSPTPSPSEKVSTYEAEAGQLGGLASIVGAPDGSDRTVGDLGGEASGRQAVKLTANGDSISFVTQASDAGANAVVIRYSIPDAPYGGGENTPLTFSISNSLSVSRYSRTLALSSRYAWLYGGIMDGTKLYNSPGNATTYATASTPTHLYDETQLKLPLALEAGDILTLTKPNSSTATSITIDFLEIEVVAPPLSQPSTLLSLTDPRCGAIAFDVNQTGAVFDGQDDSSYGSVFNAVVGTNPNNPTSFITQEKDYYSNAAGDPLQDAAPNAAVGGLSMFALADHNFKSLETCISLASASGSGYSGVWIPPGRFYARGLLTLPSAITLQGAGFWYSKFVAVNTSPPSAVTVNGVAGIAGLSGNLVIKSQAAGSSQVNLSGFSMFGNVTERDTVDAVAPFGVHGEFSSTALDHLWIEHYFIGLNANASSNAVTISNSRVRNTFADGIDFYGDTSNSSITNCEARSTGDDGVALWAQGTTLATISQNNTVSSSVARLQWYGNGFAIYGGNANTLTSSNAYDILNYPCLQASTQFVSSSLPSSASMSAAISNSNFYRCGGNGFNNQFGAILLGTDLENINGLTLENINIFNPTYKGIEYRTIPSPASKTVVATLEGVAITNVSVTNAPICAVVDSYMGGSAQLSNVCYCASPSAVPTACSGTNSSASTFQLNIGEACSLQNCNIQ